MHFYSEFLTLGAVGGLRTADMIFTLVSFIVLLALLKKFAWGPLMDVMEKREEYVKDEIETAEKNRKEAEIASKEATAQLRQTKEEAQKIIDDARNTGKQEEQKIIQTAREEATRLKEAAEADIQNEKEKAIQALQDQVASLSVLIASKVIEKEISAQDQEKLISEYIKEVGEER
ncbi:F0F1 ATP synthase subunit B [Cerasibacillus terrae]|uniref:ATP synthase subunit b n=1 Tax=Cerasibacillus terrae TaxID=2498845 RepID=A0A5C8P017_9BACI|nr:F0F1 ATP synthase subunit B [Cerasibacillus terrae]TXL66633.1 F0F1 ATP synthase subunit B [Cerasibacillus terrae]